MSEGGSPSADWHRELLDQMASVVAARSSVLSSETVERLGEYFAFRHFYCHGCSFTLDWEKIEELVTALPAVWAQTRAELELFLEDCTPSARWPSCTIH